MPASPWWRGAVLYQLYVRSWRDSDGDGYGDIRGILDRPRPSLLARGRWILAVAHDALAR